MKALLTVLGLLLALVVLYGLFVFVFPMVDRMFFTNPVLGGH